MWKATVALSGVLSWTGCGVLGNPQVDNPVLGPPPPRMAMAQPAERPSNDLTPRPYGDDPQNISLTAVSVDRQAPALGEYLHGSQVVATVNGNDPIFDSEVLERYGLHLDKAARELPPEEMHKLRRDLIKRDLQGHVDRKLLVHSLRSTLKKEQIEMLDGHLAQMFEVEVNRLKTELKVNSRHEVELHLEKQGTSLENLRDSFTNQRMAMEYLGAKAKDIPEPSRPDMLRYYEEHIADYTEPAQVKWQQITLNFARQGGQQQALRRLEMAIEELKAGADFGDVARGYSDGVTAAKGGQWDWTQKGSLADARVDEALFALPEGTIGPPFVGETDCQLVRVVSRREAHTVPFDKLQDEIKETLKTQQRQAATKTVLEDLYANAIVETIFD